MGYYISAGIVRLVPRNTGAFMCGTGYLLSEVTLFPPIGKEFTQEIPKCLSANA